jgi:hypothetical protein
MLHSLTNFRRRTDEPNSIFEPDEIQSKAAKRDDPLATSAAFIALNSNHYGKVCNFNDLCTSLHDVSPSQKRRTLSSC